MLKFVAPVVASIAPTVTVPELMLKLPVPYETAVPEIVRFPGPTNVWIPEDRRRFVVSVSGPPDELPNDA